MNFTPYIGRAQWPFVFLLDEQYRHTGWALLHGPIVTGAQQTQFVELRRAGYRFVGMSSYLTFPRGCEGDPLDYETVCDAWCHCFRQPERFFLTALPLALISDSDFTDCHRVSPEKVAAIAPERRVDFVYVGATEPWKRAAKNWRLAARSIPRLCSELDLRALVIGSPTAGFGPSERITFCASLPWPVLLAHIAHARFLYIPNVQDPSPRVITEALSLNVPIVVNRCILGGWKYVNPFTGAFFDDETDVDAVAKAVCAASLTPRAWFRANYGPYLAGKRLLWFLRSVDPALKEQSFLQLSEPVAEPAPVRSH